jgi:hypothetical protein
MKRPEYTIGNFSSSAKFILRLPHGSPLGRANGAHVEVY